MSSRPPPYIGLTGFMTSQEVEAVLDGYPENARHKVMIGTLASRKTLVGSSNKYPRRYPLIENLGTIFTDHPQALNLVHYNTDDLTDLKYQMRRIESMTQPYSDGFQLNIAWPSVKALKYWRERTSEPFTMVLQCGSSALAEVDRSPMKLAETLKAYSEFIDYVLIDPSGGRGEDFDVDFAKRCFAEIDKIDSLGYGVAGGLHAGNLERLEPLIRGFPDFSIDAESRLRDANDDLDIEKAKEYLLKAAVLFG